MGNTRFDRGGGERDMWRDGEVERGDGERRWREEMERECVKGRRGVLSRILYYVLLYYNNDSKIFDGGGGRLYVNGWRGGPLADNII